MACRKRGRLEMDHVYCALLVLMVLFTMHLSYGFIRNPCDIRVFEYRSHHSIAYSMNTYRVFISSRYRTFTPFYASTFFLCSEFTLHMMSTYSPSIFNTVNLSYGMSELRYAQGHQELLHLFLCVHQRFVWWTRLPGKW